jgi:hypothetical protein
LIDVKGRCEVAAANEGLRKRGVASVVDQGYVALAGRLFMQTEAFLTQRVRARGGMGEIGHPTDCR